MGEAWIVDEEKYWKLMAAKVTGAAILGGAPLFSAAGTLEKATEAGRLNWLSGRPAPEPKPVRGESNAGCLR